MLTWETYKLDALRTINPTLSPWDSREVALLGLYGEAGELCDMVKKSIGQGHPEDAAWRDKLRLELGDLMWYVNYAAMTLGTRVNAIEAHGTLSAFERSVPLMPLCRPGRECRMLMHQIVGLDNLGAGHAYIVGAKLSRIAVGVTRLARAYGMSLAEVLQANLDKLTARYPEGFDPDASLKRQA